MGGRRRKTNRVEKERRGKGKEEQGGENGSVAERGEERRERRENKVEREGRGD